MYHVHSSLQVVFNCLQLCTPLCPVPVSDLLSPMPPDSSYQTAHCQFPLLFCLQPLCLINVWIYFPWMVRYIKYTKYWFKWCFIPFIFLISVHSSSSSILLSSQCYENIHCHIIAMCVSVCVCVCVGDMCKHVCVYMYVLYIYSFCILLICLYFCCVCFFNFIFLLYLLI